MSQEALQNKEPLSHFQEIHEQLKQINYNLQHTNAEYLRAEFDDIEGNHEAYQILIDGLKDSLLSGGKLDRSDFSTTIFLQIIGKIKGIYKGKPDGSWGENTEKLLDQVFTKEELNNIKIDGEGLLKKTYLTGEKHKIKNEITEQEKPQIEDIKLTKNPLETSEKYKEFSKFSETKTINGKELIVLNDEIISCLERYKNNKEPLLKLLGNQDKVNLFLELQNTDYGKELVDNTNIIKNINLIAEKLQIVNPEKNPQGQELSLEILTETQKLIRDIQIIQNELNTELKNLMLSKAKVNNAMSCHVPFEELFGKQLKEKYEPFINEKIKNYSENILEKIILNNSTNGIVKNGQKFELPIGKNNVILDFSKLPKNINFEKTSKEELLKIAKQNFDKIYINTIQEKISYNIEKAYNYAKTHPEKLSVDVVSIVVSGIVAIGTVGVVSSGTGGLGAVPSIAVAGTSFTLSDNAIRGVGYGIIGEAGFDSVDGKKGFGEGFKEGIGLNQDKILSQKFITKKGLELLTNTVLFGIFKAGGEFQKLLTSSLKENGATKTLEFINKYVNEYTKTIPEAMFFTEFGVLASTIEETVSQIQNIQGVNRTEAFEIFKNEFKKLHTPETLMQYFAYNLGFIGLVKIGIHAGGGQILENKVTNILLLKEGSKIKKLSNEINGEILRLNSNGITLTKKTDGALVFYDKDLKCIDLSSQELQRFFEIQARLSEQIIDSQRILTNPNNGTKEEPNSGKGTKAQSNKITLDTKYEKLERLSKKTETEGLNFALGQEGISKSIQEKGVQKGTQEGLIKEAGFSENEAKALKDYEAKKGSNDLKDRAVERMNVAVEVVKKELDGLKNEYYKLKSLKKDMNPLFEKYNPKVRTQIEKLLMNLFI